MRIGASLLLSLTLVLGAAGAAEKPDFSGTWLVNKDRSALSNQRLATMDRGVFVIQHDGQTFKVTRTFTFEAGDEDTLSFEFPTDGREVVTEEKGRTTISSIRWFGSTLVFTTCFILPDDEEVTNVVHYTLLDDGTSLLAEETVEGKSVKHHNLWLFDRQ